MSCIRITAQFRGARYDLFLSQNINIAKEVPEYTEDTPGTFFPNPGKAPESTAIETSEKPKPGPFPLPVLPTCIKMSAC